MKICVIGLGYVGLPLALKLANYYDVMGFDIDISRVEELKNGHDRTAEVSSEDLKKTSLHLTCKKSDLKGHNLYIITVPTPVTSKNSPDLSPLKKASTMVGKAISKGSIVVYESTVYPGVTEDFCGKILEKTSGLKSGVDFFLGYSPERINPGDKIHTVDKITKIVAGQTPEITQTLKAVYGKITTIFAAKNIKTAEAAKVIENTQRDINIAFMNELTAIFHADQISIHDVLEAAQTKWNFLPFTPGLVGGHCIGVDPYYLASYAKKKGTNPRMTLAGRHINDGMSQFFAKVCDDALNKKPSSILIFGLTFKENVPDLRNTKIVDLIHHLEKKGHKVQVVDPLANPKEAKDYYDLDLAPLQDLSPSHYDCLIAAVPHKEFLNLPYDFLASLGKPSACVLDIKNMWSALKLPYKKIVL